MDSAIEVSDLRKSYGVVADDAGISFESPRTRFVARRRGRFGAAGGSSAGSVAVRRG
jgi:hypothetical protein